jgi:mycofactocin system transcriptional regulator
MPVNASMIRIFMVDEFATKGRMGRPPATSAHSLELVALDLFVQQGYANTTVDQIAVGAGVNKRTFFRYFRSKADVFWREFDAEVDLIRSELAKTSPELPLMPAIREAVLAASRYPEADVPHLHARMGVIGSEPELIGRFAMHQEAWAREVSEFVAGRTGQPADSLYPLAVGRATLGTCRAAYDRWAAHGDSNYTRYLEAALSALAAGFPETAIVDEPQARPRGR